MQKRRGRENLEGIKRDIFVDTPSHKPISFPSPVHPFADFDHMVVLSLCLPFWSRVDDLERFGNQVVNVILVLDASRPRNRGCLYGADLREQCWLMRHGCEGSEDEPQGEKKRNGSVTRR